MRAKLAINSLLFAKGCCEGVTIMELNLLLLFFLLFTVKETQMFLQQSKKTPFKLI